MLAFKKITEEKNEAGETVTDEKWEFWLRPQPVYQFEMADNKAEVPFVSDQKTVWFKQADSQIMWQF
jgi:hypothetical protein